jgi:hypothetical protein
MNIPEGSTHEWVPDGPDPHYLTRLRFYKKIADEWWVFSDTTGWRRTLNGSKWFEEETKLGFFKEINSD